MRNAMENASFVIPTSDHAPLSKFVPSVILALSKEDVPYVAGLESPMLIIAKSVLKWKRTETAVQK